MSDRPLIAEIGEWLIDQALAEPDIAAMFQQTCQRLDGAGVPLGRARLTWRTLHPLFRAETVLWRRHEGVEFEQFRHAEEASDEWLRSPMKYMLDSRIDTLRRHLDGPNERIDFDMTRDLKAAGYTDYLAVITGLDGQDAAPGADRVLFSGPGEDTDDGKGIIVTWAADRPGGFSDDDIRALQEIQRRFAVACKTVIQSRIARTVTETYLGREAGREVLSGSIKLGDGRRLQAVVWYADLRRSTPMADAMPAEDFLRMLNEYFVHTAGAVLAEGGEVLDFIGDAVLAIFPYDCEVTAAEASARARRAMSAAFANLARHNGERTTNALPALEFGVGLQAGEVTFGNIGVDARLTFSAIGSAINEAARIEHMTKTVGLPGLATERVARHEPEAWISVGEHSLTGISAPCELFALREIAETRVAAE